MCFKCFGYNNNIMNIFMRKLVLHTFSLKLNYKNKIFKTSLTPT